MDALCIFSDRVILDGRGRRFVPRVIGRERADQTWEAWIEFWSDDGKIIRVTDRETTQPNRGAVEYWVAGLEPVYYEGAFLRALQKPAVARRARAASRRANQDARKG